MTTFTSTRARTALGALALLPTLVIYAPITHYGNDFAGAAFAATGIYFLAVLTAAARSRRRRWWALGLTAASLAVEVTLLMVGNTDLGLQTAVYFSIPIAYVASWGIARREHSRWWKVGLPLAALTVIIPLRIAAATWVTDGTAPPVSLWLLGPGVVALGSAVCWLVDARSRRSS